MDNRSVMKCYLQALWKDTLQRVLTAMDIAALVVFFVKVIDDWVELGCAVAFVLLLLSGNYLIFKRQQERIRQLEASLATEERSISATSLLLADEVTQNLEAFEVYWREVSQLGEASNDPTQSKLALARRAIELHLPAWSCLVWRTQRALLTRALSPEQLRQVQAIYRQLEEVTAIRSELQSLMDEQQVNLRAGGWSDGGAAVLGVPGPPGGFDNNAPALWDRLKGIALALTAEGNPLEQGNHQHAA